jgi:hypothetical protein
MYIYLYNLFKKCSDVFIKYQLTLYLTLFLFYFKLCCRDKLFTENIDTYKSNNEYWSINYKYFKFSTKVKKRN